MFAKWITFEIIPGALQELANIAWACATVRYKNQPRKNGRQSGKERSKSILELVKISN